jgi:hypothetical protein
MQQSVHGLHMREIGIIKAKFTKSPARLDSAKLTRLKPRIAGLSFMFDV